MLRSLHNGKKCRLASYNLLVPSCTFESLCVTSRLRVLLGLIFGLSHCPLLLCLSKVKVAVPKVPREPISGTAYCYVSPADWASSNLELLEKDWPGRPFNAWGCPGVNGQTRVPPNFHRLPLHVSNHFQPKLACSQQFSTIGSGNHGNWQRMMSDPCQVNAMKSGVVKDMSKLEDPDAF